MTTNGKKLSGTHWLSSLGALGVFFLATGCEIGPVALEGSDDDLDAEDSSCPMVATTRWQGALEWQFEGAIPTPVATVRRSNRRTVAEPVYLASKPQWHDAPLAYMGVGQTTRVDQCGLWRLVDVDVDLVDERVADYNADVVREFGPEPTESVGPDVGVGDWVDGQLAVKTSWDADNCDGETGKDLWVNSDNYFEKINSSYNTTQRKMVWFEGGCSGVVIDDDATSSWVLTAAHCVTDDVTGDPLLGAMTVCTYGNVQASARCFSTLEIRINGGNYDGSVANDYAIVRLNGRPGVGTMPLSGVSDSVLDDYTHYDRGYPRYEDDCDEATVTSNAVTINDSFRGRHLWKTRGEVRSTVGNLLKTDASGAKGMSGSPHYYCPNGPQNCSTSSYVTAVQSVAWNAAPSGWRMGGPKARTFSTWVIANID